MRLAEALVEVARKEAAAPKKEKRRPWNVANVRSGRRPMSVSTMMKKEKDGTLQVKIGSVEQFTKLAEEFGIPFAQKAMRAQNPTLMGHMQGQAAYKALDPNLQKLIESHPLVTQHGMTPQAAHQVASWSLQPGQGLGDFFAKEHLQGSPSSGARPAGGAGTVGATPKSLPQAATNASGVRPMAGTVASPTGPAAAPKPTPSVPVRGPSGAPSMIGGQSVANVNPLGKTLAAGPAAAAPAAVKKPGGLFSNLVNASIKKPPAQIGMKPLGGALAGAAKALPAIKPGGAMANVFQAALKHAAAEPGFLEALMKVAQFYGPIVPFTDQTDRGASPTPRSRLDKITSRENIANEAPKREDGRDFVAFENAPGTQLNEVAATNSPQERTASVKFAGTIANMGKFFKGTSPLAAHANEAAGLGILAVPAADTLQAHVRSHLAGEGSRGAEKRQLIGEPGHALAEIGGLGVLAGPAVHGLLHHGH